MSENSQMNIFKYFLKILTMIRNSRCDIFKFHMDTFDHLKSNVIKMLIFTLRRSYKLGNNFFCLHRPNANKRRKTDGLYCNRPGMPE